MTKIWLPEDKHDPNSAFKYLTWACILAQHGSPKPTEIKNTLHVFTDKEKERGTKSLLKY